MAREPILSYANVGRATHGHRGSRAARVGAVIGLALPVLLVSPMYVEWFWDWLDPLAGVRRGWVHGLVGYCLLGMVLGFPGGGGLVGWHVHMNPMSPRRAVAWLCGWIGVWAGMAVLFAADPGGVWRWWLD